MQPLPLFNDEYLFAHFEGEYLAYMDARDGKVRQVLQEWNERDKELTETQLNSQFIQKFFHQLWEYWGTGTPGATAGYTLLPEYAIENAGQAGGIGKADLAMGHFSNSEFSDSPQVLCEFKGIKSGLDAPQNRKGNTRSPVQQCLDYLKHSFDKSPVNSSVVPTWGIVTDMDEFRLYYRKLGGAQYQRFSITSEKGGRSMLDTTNEAARQRFLFWKLFSYDMLLARAGISHLERLLKRQWIYAKGLEKSFYSEYQAYRQQVYEAIIEANPDFVGTRGDLVRMTQRFLDRCIFLLFCEDMGQALRFPVDLLRDILVHESLSQSYSPAFDNIWSLVKRLFHTMRDGGPFPPDHHIDRFNGGLFADLQDLEQLCIPNRVFCARGQGESPDTLVAYKDTLLYLSATYNFGATAGNRERTITLYTLGRIFEQSITDLEYMHADADCTPTVAKQSKRRRDGVYYTPEWITAYIVQQVLGRRLFEERERLGLQLGVDISREDLLKYRKPKIKPKTNPATVHIRRLDQYEVFLNHIKILDPACGSGAFLIQVLQFLQDHRRDLAVERERVTGDSSLFDQDAVIRGILGNNLFGVDINPESVEITQLALWLHTAAPGRPLSTLADNIQCGNSLVENDFAQFYQSKHTTLFEAADRSEQEKVNAFDWAQNFPSILGHDVSPDERGFDCVIGNPPYVKLQHFRKVVPDVAEYLIAAQVRREGGQTDDRELQPRYASTQEGNFDLYLPFIERGVSLLNRHGHMGYIAPSVWLLNEYGRGLKKWLVANRHMERWIDFKDFPVFEEAMTYTALQFFSARPVPGFTFASAADGELASVEDEGFIEYESLDPSETWVFLPDRERQLIARLGQSCTRLVDHPHVSHIFQGVITSADYVFHFERLGPGRYLHFPPNGDPEEVQLEDDVMRPLLSGSEAKRYQSPKTIKYLLFPYDDSKVSGATLVSAGDMEKAFPRAWSYLSRYEAELRAREGNAFDDEQWYRFGRNQNIDKQRLKKLGVAQTVPEMRVFYDSDGRFCLNNVRVNGILVDESYAWFILAVLNARVADFVFRRGAKPKEPRPSGAYFEANKQYIAPIPIPGVNAEQLLAVTALAKELQRLHTSRRESIEALSSRLQSPQMRPNKRSPNWIWADVLDKETWATNNPERLAGRKLQKWAREQHEKLLTGHLAEMDARISFGQTMFAYAEDGSLKFVIGNECLIKVFASAPETKVILPQWMEIARDSFVSESLDAARIVDRLLDLRTTDNEALIQQLAEHTDALIETERRLRDAEQTMDNYIYDLYNLSADEREIVIAATSQRVNARLPGTLN